MFGRSDWLSIDGKPSSLLWRKTKRRLGPSVNSKDDDDDYTIVLTLDVREHHRTLCKTVDTRTQLGRYANSSGGGDRGGSYMSVRMRLLPFTEHTKKKKSIELTNPEVSNIYLIRTL